LRETGTWFGFAIVAFYSISKDLVGSSSGYIRALFQIKEKLTDIEFYGFSELDIG